MPIRIYIDQGHNPYGFNAGAEGFGLREQDITYLVGAYLANILNADSRFTAITSRTSPDEILGYDTNSSLRTRTEQANQWGADYFLSIHTNANVNPAINGTEAYVYAVNTPSYCKTFRYKKQRYLCPSFPLRITADQYARRPH